MNENKLKPEEKIEEVIFILSGRRGFDGWWDNIEEEDQCDIKKELANIINDEQDSR